MKNYKKDHLLQIIRKIAKENLSTENVDICFGKGSEKLDGFMGEILTIQVRDEKTQKELNLVAKISLKDEKLRKYTAIEQSYKNEIAAYKKFFPAIHELRNQLKISQPISSLVTFYHASETEDEEYLIMENIKVIGFQMLPVRLLLKSEEVNLIFKCYAELHASSMALKALNYEKFDEITSKNVSVFRSILDMKISKDIVHSLNSIHDAMKEKNYDHILLQRYTEDPLEFLKKKMDFKNEKYVSFLHGDGWSNNMMFRYEVKNAHQTLIDMKLLDWQAWTIGPPVIDLLFCLFSSCSEEIFLDFDRHIDIYYKNFSEILGLYNLKATDIYPYEEMQKQIEKHFHFPAVFGLMIRKIRSFDQNHCVDPVNYQNHDDDSTFFDAVREMEFDKDYLLNNLTYMLEFLDKKFHKNQDL